MAGIEPDWSRIFKDLLPCIAKFLPTRIDILRLRAVCRSFRATIPLPPIQYPFPNSVLTNTNFIKGPNPKENGVFTLTASTVYAIEPLSKISNTQDEDTPHMWVIKVNESNSGRVRVSHPLIRKGFRKLSKLPKPLNLLDYRVTGICTYYELDSAVGFDFSKVVFSSFLDEHDDEFAVMAMYDDLMELGMWRNVDQKWSHIDIGLLSDEYFEDIIYYNDKFYALLSKGRTMTVDPKSLIVTEVAADIHSFSDLSLVGSFNDLVLVGQYDDDDSDFNYIAVLKLNQKEGKWVRLVDGLDFIDRVLFVGEFGCAFSISMKKFPRFKGGCVSYVIDDFLDDCSFNYPEQLILICDLDYGTFVPKLSFFPGLSILWPLPAWLNDRPQLEANASEEKQRRERGDDCERKIPRLMP